jgi:hypothetical protein
LDKPISGLRGVRQITRSCRTSYESSKLQISLLTVLERGAILIKLEVGYSLKVVERVLKSNR